MFRDKINLETAKGLSKSGHITIVDCSPESIPPFPGEGEVWKENFNILQSKYRHIPRGKLLTFLSARYLIEVSEGLVDNTAGTYSWRYFYGIENTGIKRLSKDNIEYVYVLVNPSHPSLVKIGMTIHDVSRRVKGINSTATVFEWVPKFALPVRKGKAFEIEQSVHAFFTPYRVSSDRGGSREFFEISPFTAFDKIREIGDIFRVGDPIVY